RRSELGFLSAWAQTVQQALFEPGRLFKSARLDKGSAQLGFAVLTASVFWSIGQLLDRFLFAGQREQMRHLLEQLSGGQLPAIAKSMLDKQNQLNSPAVAVALALF